MNKAFIMPLQELKNGTKQIVLSAGLSLLKPKFFNVDIATVEDESSAFDDAGYLAYDKKSRFGTPFFDIVSFGKIKYTNDLGREINIEPFDLNIALIEVNKPRNIVRTVIAGRSGTIKEYMSDGDYEISISGTLANKLAYTPPAEEINILDLITKAPMELVVTSNFLNYFEIYSIVIVNSKIKQREGARNIVDYELTCISDTPFEIRSEDETRGNTTQSNAMF
jgi:hypothetical protein